MTPHSLGRTLESLCEGLNKKLDANVWRILWTAVALCFLNWATISASKRMWVDELYTFYVASQLQLTQIVRAVAEGCDSQPPLYAILVSLFSRVLGLTELSVRLPSLLGFCGMLVCVFFFLRRRLPVTYVFLAMAMPICFSKHATEGRCYGLVLGFSSAALLVWQNAGKTQLAGLSGALSSPLSLAICLAFATAFNYMSLVQSFPLFVGEVVRGYRTGEIRLSMYFALAAPLPIVALHWPLITSAGPMMKHFWSPAGWHQMGPLLPPAILVCSSGFLIFRNQQYLAGCLPSKCLKSEEWAVLLTTSVMPPFVLAISIFTTHIFVDRYILWALPAFSILVAVEIAHLVKGRLLVGSILLGTLVLSLVFIGGRELSAEPRLKEGEAARQQLANLPATQLDTVIGNQHVYMELAYYGDAELKHHIVCLLQPELSLRYFGYDTDSLLLGSLRYRVPRLKILPLAAFLSCHKRFLLVTGKADWCYPYFSANGYHLTSLGSKRNSLIYLVTSPTT